MGSLAQLFGFLARAPLPGDPDYEGLVLVVTGQHWRVERGGELVAEGVLSTTGALAITVEDFCRVLGLRRHEKQGH